MKIKDFTPVESYIIVESLEKTSGEGIEIIADEFPQLAKVISIGADSYNAYTDRKVKAPCKVGQTILHSAGGFETLKFEGKEYRIVNFSKILAIKK